MLETCGSGKLVQFNIVVQQALRYSRHYGTAGDGAAGDKADLGAQLEAV